MSVTVMLPIKPSDIDVIEAGQGPLVVLVHSSVSGARQWRRLIDVLAGSYQVKAINLHGYGRTPAWSQARPQTLADQAALVRAVVPDGATGVALVGHSFGASVAMQAARELGGRVRCLALLEPNPFFLLRDNDRPEAFAEIEQLCEMVKAHVARGEWARAAEMFGDYWGGSGTWAATGPERRAAFIDALKPNMHEWDGVMFDTTPLSTWAEQLPARTLIVYDPATKRPIREIVEIMAAVPAWQTRTIPHGGHMAPLTQPAIVNPIVAEFLAGIVE